MGVNWHQDVLTRVASIDGAEASLGVLLELVVFANPTRLSTEAAYGQPTGKQLQCEQRHMQRSAKQCLR